MLLQAISACSSDLAVVATSGKPPVRWMPHSVWLARTIASDGAARGSNWSSDSSCASVAEMLLGLVAQDFPQRRRQLDVADRDVIGSAHRPPARQLRRRHQASRRGRRTPVSDRRTDRHRRRRDSVDLDRLDRRRFRRCRIPTSSRFGEAQLGEFDQVGKSGAHRRGDRRRGFGQFDDVRRGMRGRAGLPALREHGSATAPRRQALPPPRGSPLAARADRRSRVRTASAADPLAEAALGDADHRRAPPASPAALPRAGGCAPSRRPRRVAQLGEAHHAAAALQRVEAAAHGGERFAIAGIGVERCAVARRPFRAPRAASVR